MPEMLRHDPGVEKMETGWTLWDARVDYQSAIKNLLSPAPLLLGTGEGDRDFQFRAGIWI
jgi:hypothetical protein